MNDSGLPNEAAGPSKWPTGQIVVRGKRFVDQHGREVLLRGANLGGDSKLPAGKWAHDFSDHRTVSFIGRPFPLAEAAEHFGRLRHWGFNCLRLLTTWEAVEHSGPGEYDLEYLDYFTQICAMAGEYGLNLFVDMHQDVWSRMSGGDGAPGWTFEAVGLDFRKFHAADAAHIMQHRYDYAAASRDDPDYPQMSWGSNYYLPANGIMWTLFWGGRHFTPEFAIDGSNVQDFLQGHYLGAMEQLARPLTGMPHVLGFDTLNEPSPGWLGMRLNGQVDTVGEKSNSVRPGVRLSPLQQLAMAQGCSITQTPLVRDSASGEMSEGEEITLNPEKVSIWRAGHSCPFESAGIYRILDGSPHALRPDAFRICDQREFDISNDAFGPFFENVAATIRKHQPDWSVFAEIDAMGTMEGRKFPESLPERTVNASHWYDVGTLFRKKFDPADAPDLFSGKVARTAEECRERFIRQLRQHAAHADEFRNGGPTLIGEFGVPMDMESGSSFDAIAQGVAPSDAFAAQAEFLGLVYDALDELGLHATLWNYSASNRNAAAIGDGWNQEDLSIYSQDQQTDPDDPDSGARALEGFCRPFARHVQGEIVSMSFEHQAKVFELIYEVDPDCPAPTEIYLPDLHFPGNWSAKLENCEILGGRGGRIVEFRGISNGTARIVISSLADP